VGASGFAGARLMLTEEAGLPSAVLGSGPASGTKAGVFSTAESFVRVPGKQWAASTCSAGLQSPLGAFLQKDIQKRRVEWQQPRASAARTWRLIWPHGA